MPTVLVPYLIYTLILGVQLMFKLGFAGGVQEQGGKELARHPLVQIELSGLWG